MRQLRYEFSLWFFTFSVGPGFEFIVLSCLSIITYLTYMTLVLGSIASMTYVYI
jgi:hypothetical protein